MTPSEADRRLGRIEDAFGPAGLSPAIPPEVEAWLATLSDAELDRLERLLDTLPPDEPVPSDVIEAVLSDRP